MRFSLRNIGILFIGLAVFFVFGTAHLRDRIRIARIRTFEKELDAVYSKPPSKTGWREIEMSDCLVEDRHLQMLKNYFPQVEGIRLKNAKWSPLLRVPHEIVRFELNATKVTPQLADAIANAASLESLMLRNYYGEGAAAEHSTIAESGGYYSRDCLMVSECLLDTISAERGPPEFIFDRVNLTSEDWRKLANFKYLERITLRLSLMAQADREFLESHNIAVEVTY